MAITIDTHLHLLPIFSLRQQMKKTIRSALNHSTGRLKVRLHFAELSADEKKRVPGANALELFPRLKSIFNQNKLKK
jgi:hypothetical protein